ncbi:N-6 DNA methylase [Melissospora conviva]|uniref:N-6 DNA methylase n=1 Tax=Melissospora conviva TaxID=3388432 RepID=UPI003C228370
MTAAEISRLAGVTRATVSNWRRRHPDFPSPVGGTEASPAYDLAAVRDWLAARGQLPESSPADELATALRTTPTDATRLLPLVLAAAPLTAAEVEELTELSDDRLAKQAQKLARVAAGALPIADDVSYRAAEAELLRAVLTCVRDEGAVKAADVLAQGEPDEVGASGAYETPPQLAALMADLLPAAGGNYPGTVFDPACGAGNLLLAAAERGAQEVYGQDMVPAQAVQAAVRLAVLAPTAKRQVVAGDSIREDAFTALLADAALCTPPYGDRDWGQEELAYDPRWIYGLPPKSEPELAWIQHCLAHLTPGGTAVLLLPPATAERGSGRRIRGELIRSGAIRAVVALPPGVAAPLHIGLHLWLLQRPHEQSAPPRQLLFIDASGAQPDRARFRGSRRPALDWPAIQEIVAGSWRGYSSDPDAFESIPGTARAVPLLDLLDESVDLTPARHTRVVPAATQPDEQAEFVEELRDRLRRANAHVATLAETAPTTSAGTAPRHWRSAAVADLLRGGALTLLRSRPVRGSLGQHTPEPSDEIAGEPVLTARDVATRRTASGVADDTYSGEEVRIETGDVILSEMLSPNHSGVARVATESDAGKLLGRMLFLLRPDPARLDPWFLAGFLSADENVNAASVGTSIVRIDARRLRIPLLPLAEQQRYGRAFRELYALRSAADVAQRLAEETATALAAGLTSGALLPSEPDSTPD